MHIAIFLIVLGLINYTLHRAVANAYPLASIYSAIVIAFFFLSLFIAISLERAGKLNWSLPFSWIGYSWLGVLTIAFPLLVITEGIQAFVPNFDNKLQLAAIASTTLILSLFAAASAQTFRINKINIVRDKGDPASKDFTVVQISDLHLGESSLLSRTKRIVQAINELKPDLIVSTGDLLDGYIELLKPHEIELRKLNAPLGKYAVIGNHEVGAGLNKALKSTEAAGFTILRNESKSLENDIAIAGVEDPVSPIKPDENAALSDIPDTRYRLLLKHRPEIDPKSIGKFDLQLSGHTHGGQIAPFHILTKLVYRAKTGLSEIGPKQFLYLSRGTGSWGPQLRLFAPSELTVFKIGTRLPQSSSSSSSRPKAALASLID